MTPRERVQAILARSVPDKLPREFKLTPPLQEEFEKRTGCTDVSEFYSMDVREVYFKAPDEHADFSEYYPEGVPKLWNPTGWEVGEWGVGVKPGSLLHFIHIQYPMLNITDISELRDYPFPDFTLPSRYGHLPAAVDGYHDRDLFVIGYMEWTIFEIAWHMRSMDKLFMDIVYDPPLAEYLLDVVTEKRCFQARKFAEAGVDMLRIGDDLGTQISTIMGPDMYREWFKPRHAAVIRAAREVRPDIHVSYHSDGAIWELIPDLIEIGVSVLNPIQPECLDIAAVKREFGKDLIFWGGIGTQTTMPFDSPEEVYDSVRRTIDTLGPTGFFPCPTHVLEPEVTWENIEAFLRAVDEYAFAAATSPSQ